MYFAIQHINRIMWDVYIHNNIKAMPTPEADLKAKEISGTQTDQHLFGPNKLQLSAHGPSAQLLCFVFALAFVYVVV